MKGNYFIGIYWGVRKESIELCIDKVQATFDLLRDFDDSFSLWYKTSRPRKGELLLPLDTRSEEGIKGLLLKGQNYNDIGELLEDSGYLIYLKSEKDFSKAHVLSIKCSGSFKEISNNVTLNIGKGSSYEHLMDRKDLEGIFKRFIEIWHPDRGLVRCNNEEIFMYPIVHSLPANNEPNNS